MRQLADIHTLAQLDAVATQLTQQLTDATWTPTWVYLVGDLGLGKTTFAQHFIAATGCRDTVTSPTYALMQDYRTAAGDTIIHCDLYRLADPEELYEIGLLDEAAANDAIVLVEWPNKGKGVLPPPDVTLTFEMTHVETDKPPLRRLLIDSNP